MDKPKPKSEVAITGVFDNMYARISFTGSNDFVADMAEFGTISHGGLYVDPRFDILEVADYIIGEYDAIVTDIAKRNIESIKTLRAARQQ